MRFKDTRDRVEENAGGLIAKIKKLETLDQKIRIIEGLENWENDQGLTTLFLKFNCIRDGINRQIKTHISIINQLSPVLTGGRA
jgi:hypothetical protein